MRNFALDAALRPQPKRDGTEWWPTPRDLTVVAIRHILPCLPPATIWECAAGDGGFAEDMRNDGYDVIASDIEPRGPNIERLDFMLDDPPQPGLIAATNPPHSDELLTPFVARGLQLLDCGKLAGLVLLWRWDHYMADERADAINRAFRIRLCSWRAKLIPGSKGNGRWAYAWIAWLPGCQNNEMFRAIRKSELLQTGLPLTAREWSGPEHGNRTAPAQQQPQATLAFADHG